MTERNLSTAMQAFRTHIAHDGAGPCPCEVCARERFEARFLSVACGCAAVAVGLLWAVLRWA